MNDDFLRRARRQPSAAFERQLRERLREQEQNETSRRRPSWRLLMITLLLGGTALATATYLTINRTPQPHAPYPPPAPAQIAADPPSEIQNRFETYGQSADWNAEALSDAAPSAEKSSTVFTAQSDKQTSSTTGAAAQTSTYAASSGSGTATTSRTIRIVVTPDMEYFAKDTAPSSRYTQSASFEVDSADAALPRLCEEDDETIRADIVITSRKAHKNEFSQCRKRRSDVLEANLGHIAIVVTRAKSGTPIQLSTRALRLALMKQVPSPENASQLIDNPYTHWNQIDASLEERRIQVLGPARDTPEFIVFAATMLAPACENSAALDRRLCESVREDGVYTEAWLDNTFVGQRLWADPNIVGIMDYRFYAANSADLLGSLLTGPAPTRESIVDGSYAGARTLRAYVHRDRYRAVAKLYLFVNQYLRMPAYVHQRVMLPTDGSLEPRHSYDSGPQLTELKLD